MDNSVTSSHPTCSHRSNDILPDPLDKKMKACDDEPKASRCPCNQRRPPVPKHTERPIRYPPSHKDYVALNASSSLLSHVKDAATVHRNQEPVRSVDSKDGHITKPLQCGLIPHFVQKPVPIIVDDFGKVPRYLRKPRKVVVISEESERQKVTTSTKTQQNTIEKEIQWLQDRWNELEKRLRSVSFSRPDKREAIEDELITIENRLRFLTKPTMVNE